MNPRKSNSPGSEQEAGEWIPEIEIQQPMTVLDDCGDWDCDLWLFNDGHEFVDGCSCSARDSVAWQAKHRLDDFDRMFARTLHVRAVFSPLELVHNRAVEIPGLGACSPNNRLLSRQA
jgi:hypothetical protein